MEKLKLFGLYVPQKDKKCVILNWNFLSDNDLFEEFIIEKSLDNKEFKIIGKENKIRQTQREFFYLFVDEEPDPIVNYYRIFLKKKGASKKTEVLSNIITIQVNKGLHVAKAPEERQRVPDPFFYLT